MVFNDYRPLIVQLIDWRNLRHVLTCSLIFDRSNGYDESIPTNLIEDLSEQNLKSSDQFQSSSLN